jgi:S1-C subfamily serine protease
VKAQFKFLSGARVGQTEAFAKAYVGLGRHPLSDVRFDAERDLDVSARHAAIVRRADTFVIQDLGSRNGTFVNGTRITGDTPLHDGDVIGFGTKGPAVEFRVLATDEALPGSTVAEAAAGRASQPRQMVAAAHASPEPPPPPPAHTPAPRPTAGAATRSTSTAVRIAVEVARQTNQLRRTTKVLFALLFLAVLAFGWIQWKNARAARELAGLQHRADSLTTEMTHLLSQFQDQIQTVRQALQQSQTEVARLRGQLVIAGSSGDAAAMTRLRAELDDAERRQRGIAGAAAVDYRGISRKNQDAVAMVIVEFPGEERFSGTAFAVDSQGTMVTNKHVLVGEEGTRTPQRIAVKFSGSRQWFPGRLVGVSDSADVGVLRVDIRGGTPRVLGVERNALTLQRGDPVAIIGYPLGFDLPMEGQSRDVQNFVAEPTLTVGTASKVLRGVVQVDGYGAPGSSGSPIFDRNGRVVAVLYGGERESNGKIIYAVPVAHVLSYLRQQGIRAP